jgi:hypothetical protein
LIYPMGEPEGAKRLAAETAAVSGWLRIGGGRWTLVAEGLEGNVRAALQAEAEGLRSCDITVLTVGVDPNKREAR